MYEKKAVASLKREPLFCNLICNMSNLGNPIKCAFAERKCRRMAKYRGTNCLIFAENEIRMRLCKREEGKEEEKEKIDKSIGETYEKKRGTATGN